jgi:beta-glucosidase
MYTALGAGVRDWTTFNEPMVHLLGGYGTGQTPPGKTDIKQIVTPLRNLLKAHAAAYHAIHALADAVRRPVRVGIVHHLRVFDADSSLNPLDQLAASTIDQAFNWTIPDAADTGHFKVGIPFVLNVDENIPDLAGTQDYMGVNYYTRDMVAFTMKGPLGVDLRVNDGSPRNDLGWEIYPEGFYRTLKTVASRYPGKPVVVTENGIADAQDRQRRKFLEDHYSAMQRAISDGVPVEGYCHWSLMDNFEWVEGFTPRFGLYEVDYATQKRTLRDSGKYFSQVAAENGIWVGE